MANLATKSAEIVELFNGKAEWEQKYLLIIELGKQLEPYPEAKRTDDFKVKGCQSQVWLNAELDASKRMKIWADSDALIVKGLAALLVRFFSGETPNDVLASEADFLQKIGLSQHLTPSRANGLVAMIKQIKYYAVAFKALQSIK